MYLREVIMCTAVSDHGRHHLFGRTLDIECSYGEIAIVTPRNFRFDFLHENAIPVHYAIMGIGCVRNDLPLYYDAINEAGLAIAGLNFPGNAVYHEKKANKHNIASFELIPWILCQCDTLSSAIQLLLKTNLTADSFSSELPSTPLHWLIADKERSVTLESVSSGMKVYENPFGILTNNPPFLFHATNITNFMHLSSNFQKNNLCPDVKIEPYSRGMGAIGLPGDFSSSSRFVKALYVKSNTQEAESDIGRFFHILQSVSVPYGCVKSENGKNVLTVYSSCANASTFTYYFTTYKCHRIQAVSVQRDLLNETKLFKYSMRDEEDILYLDSDGK